MAVEIFEGRSNYSGDIGNPVTPASIPEFDFSALDKALETEQKLADKAVGTLTTNIQNLGKIQDELTGIQSGNPYLSTKLEQAKKKNGIDSDAFSSALTNMDNPAALYDLDRKMKRLITDPDVKEIMRDNERIDFFKDNLTSIADPNLRAMAIKDLEDVMLDNDGTYRPDSLNLSLYQPMDVTGAYIDVLERIAPETTKVVTRKDADGNSTQVEITSRDPAQLKRGQDLFMKDATVMNNLKARGIITIDKDGKPVIEKDPTTGKSFFDIIEEGLATESEKGEYYTSAAKTKDIKTTTTGEVTFEEWEPNVWDGIDLGLIAEKETGILKGKTKVHVDTKGNQALNFGHYSFNGGPSGAASPFFGWLAKQYPNSAALKELQSLNLREPTNEAKATELYEQLAEELTPEKLAELESAYVLDNYGGPVIRKAEKLGIKNLTNGEKTVLTDAAIQHGQTDVDKWVKEYANNSEGLTLIDYITKKRSDLSNGAYKSRANTIAHNARKIDGAGAAAAQAEKPDVAAKYLNKYEAPTTTAAPVAEATAEPQKKSEPVAPATPPPAAPEGETYDQYIERLKGVNPNFGNDDISYNYKGAYAAGLEPEKDPDTGEYHLPSRNPETGEILKTETHPTFDQSVEDDLHLGFVTYRTKDGIFSNKSVPEGAEVIEPFAFTPTLIPLSAFNEMAKAAGTPLVEKGDNYLKVLGAYSEFAKAYGYEDKGPLADEFVKMHAGKLPKDVPITAKPPQPQPTKVDPPIKVAKGSTPEGTAALTKETDETLLNSVWGTEKPNATAPERQKYFNVLAERYGIKQLSPESSYLEVLDSLSKLLDKMPDYIDSTSKSSTDWVDGAVKGLLIKGKLPADVTEGKAKENAAQIALKAAQDSGKSVIDFAELPFSETAETSGLAPAIRGYAGYGYHFGGKTSSTAIDCSGFVYKVLQETYGVKFSKGIKYTDAQQVWLESSNRKEYKTTSEVPADLADGTVIAFDTGKKSWDADRKYGIDHVAVVLRDASGEAWIAESADGKNGVVVTPLKTRLNEIDSIGLVKIYTGTYSTE